VNAAPLLRGVEDAARGGPKSLVIVGNHQLDPAQPAVGKATEKVCPERLGFRGAGRNAQHLALAIFVHSDGHYHGTADDPSAPGESHLKK
jgi:hypothetical protein